MKINFKRSEEYKRIRRKLSILLGYPDYADKIVNGVSFKWYKKTYKIYTTSIFRKHLEENIRELMSEIFEDFDVIFKIIEPFNEKYVYGSRRYSGPILRILVKRKNEKTSKFEEDIKKYEIRSKEKKRECKRARYID